MADDYEREFMEGDALYREKSVSRGGFAFLAGLATLIGSLSPILFLTLPEGARWAALMPLPSALITAACAVLFVTLRVAVTRSHVHVQYGLAGPKIAVERITAVRAERYSWREWGGWGVKMRGKGQWAYSSTAAGDGGVRIEHLGEDGAPCVTWVSAKDPAVLVEAIERARHGGSYREAQRVRVDVEADDELEAEAAKPSSKKRRAE